jgi:serine/threonine protein phosphatase PrpC
MDILRFPLKDNGPQGKAENVKEGLPVGPASHRKTLPDHPSALHELQVGLASDPGRIRERNEDTSLALQFMLVQQGQPPLPVGFFLIADGMGGHVLGEQASALAARMAARHVISHVYLPFLDEDEGATDRAPINEVLEASMSIAHQAVRRRLPKAGTTMTIALALGDGVYIAHVGDSRAYLGVRGHIDRLTQDHSMAARLLEMGQASSEEAAPQRHILYKAVGQGAQIEPDILYRDLGPGQYLLLCCDGLWDKVPDQEMSAIIDASPTPGLACRNLVARANENGGEDNISVILAARGWPLAAGGQADRQ